MPTTAVLTEQTETLADLLDRLGNVPLHRILSNPAPGTATPADVQRLGDAVNKRLCELVDGVLVEKPMGHCESQLAMILGHFILVYLESNDIGIVTGETGPYRLFSHQVRMPDVSYISYDRIPKTSGRRAPIPEWIPNLAVEILSESNTAGEMKRKLKDYFEAGVELVWIADPQKQTVTVYDAPHQSQMLRQSETLTGGTVLPGFELHLKEWFERGTQLKTAD